MDKGKCRGADWAHLERPGGQATLAIGDRLQPGLAGLWRLPRPQERQGMGRLGKGTHICDGPAVAHRARIPWHTQRGAAPGIPGLEDSPGGAGRAGSHQKAVVKQGPSWTHPRHCFRVSSQDGHPGFSSLPLLSDDQSPRQ